MGVSPLAGKLPPASLLIDVDRLVRDYFEKSPDVNDPGQRVSFGTSGHRGTPEDGSFTEAHILAISQAICEYRASKGISGPLFLAKDTHAIDTPAHDTALEVLAANGVETIIAVDNEYTPVPVMSRAILAYNKGRKRSGLADGIAVTPSHNPPRDGGFKYNPPTGGPADVDVTGWVEDRANALLREGNKGVKRVSFERACAAGTTHRRNLLQPYIDDLGAAVDMDIIRSSGLPDWGRSAGRGERPYLVWNRGEVWTESDGRKSYGRFYFSVYAWIMMGRFGWIVRARMRWRDSLN